MLMAKRIAWSLPGRKVARLARSTGCWSLAGLLVTVRSVRILFLEVANTLSNFTVCVKVFPEGNLFAGDYHLVFGVVNLLTTKLH